MTSKPRPRSSVTGNAGCVWRIRRVTGLGCVKQHPLERRSAFGLVSCCQLPFRLSDAEALRQMSSTAPGAQQCYTFCSLTFPVAFRKAVALETTQNGIEISPTAGETCAEYCNKLRMRPRTTHPAVDIADTATGEGQLGKRQLALVYTRHHIWDPEPEEAQRVVEVVGIGYTDFWKAYWDLLIRKGELVTGKLIRHGADVSKLPKPC